MSRSTGGGEIDLPIAVDVPNGESLHGDIPVDDGSIPGSFSVIVVVNRVALTPESGDDLIGSVFVEIGAGDGVPADERVIDNGPFH